MASTPETYFDRLGSTIDERWSSAGRRHHELPDIACGLLAEAEVPSDLDARAVLRRLALDEDMPKQRKPSDPFGQPPAVMFSTSGLEVHALTWMEGSTSIHQHGFDGAFRVLQGSSLHVTYEFDPGERLADGHLLVGRLKLRQVEVLEAGDTRPIVSGPEFIHSLFHLERPSVTIVVRNGWSDLPFPQYDYRLPGLGYDALYEDRRLGMRMRGLSSLHQLDPEAALRLALEVVSTEGLWTAFRTAEYWFQHINPPDGFDDLVAALAARDSSLGTIAHATYGEAVRRSRLQMRRSMLHEPRHRLLLALLLNLPDADSVLSALQLTHPARPPGDVLLGLVEELASPAYRGISGLNLTPGDLERLRAALAAGQIGAGLSLLGSQWVPPDNAALLV